MPYLAQALDHLADRRAEAGRGPEDLRAGDQAVGTWEWLAQVSPDANPDAYLADLAGSLENQANRLVQAGRLPDGIDTCERAIRLRKRLSPTSNPDAFLLDLAGSLNNLSKQLANAGRHPKALHAAEQAAVISIKVAETTPISLPLQALSLMNISDILTRMGRLREALAVGEQAVAVAERLPQVTIFLAASLNNLSLTLRGSRRRAEALAVAKRAVAVSERLMTASPDGADAWTLLVSSLITLSGVARRAEAAQAWEDATIRVGPAADVDLRLLWKCWNWIRTPTSEAERDFLATHPELLANGSEDQLAHFLRLTTPGQAERYLILIGTARARSVSYAYRDLCR